MFVPRDIKRPRLYPPQVREGLHIRAFTNHYGEKILQTYRVFGRPFVPVGSIGNFLAFHVDIVGHHVDGRRLPMDAAHRSVSYVVDMTGAHNSDTELTDIGFFRFTSRLFTAVREAQLFLPPEEYAQYVCSDPNLHEGPVDWL